MNPPPANFSWTRYQELVMREVDRLHNEIRQLRAAVKLLRAMSATHETKAGE